MLEIAFDAAVSLLGVAVVAQHGWALRGHFVSPTVPTGMKVISATAVATALIYLFLMWSFTQPIWAQVAGIAVMGVSLALFWVTIAASREARLGLAFNTDAPTGIVMNGPYRYVRHPFYTSYLIFWTGWAIASWSLWAAVPLAVIVVIYSTAALGEERKFADSELSVDYASYRQRTGLFWPKVFG